MPTTQTAEALDMPASDVDPTPPSAAPRPTLRLHVWLELANGHFFGLGRAQLLLRIQQHGSLSKAAEEMRMSYRAAWGKIKSTEEIMGVKLVEKVGGNKSGFRLTEYGEKIMKDFLAWYVHLERQALKSAAKKLPWELQRYNAND
jgi:molybdate transport system regulatory protein